MTVIARLLRNQSAASAVEFALMLPLLLLLLLGMVDAGRFMWEFNRAEKATQMGVRYAVVADPVVDNLYGYSFAVNDGVIAGTTVPAANFTSATCDKDSCACDPDGSDFCTAAAIDPDAFDNIVARMTALYPAITEDNVEVEYRNVGLGFAGDPNGPDVSALVTVKLKDLTFQPITCLMFACSITMPDFRAALTLEDGSGTVSN